MIQILQTLFIFASNIKAMAKFKKRHYFIGVFILIISAVLFFLSTFTKNYLVRNSEKLIGRKLEISEIHFNYAKVYPGNGSGGRFHYELKIPQFKIEVSIK